MFTPERTSLLLLAVVFVAFAVVRLGCGRQLNVEPESADITMSVDTIAATDSIPLQSNSDKKAKKRKSKSKEKSHSDKPTVKRRNHLDENL